VALRRGAQEPGGLYQVAKHKAIDAIRREQSLVHLTGRLYDPTARPATGPPADLALLDGELADDTLRMMFTCCHPALAPDAAILIRLI